MALHPLTSAAIEQLKKEPGQLLVYLWAYEQQFGIRPWKVVGECIESGIMVEFFPTGN